jgi:hypothetical protein
VKRLKWKLGSFCFETVLILMQDRCIVCTERTICSEIDLDAPVELLDDVCHMESCSVRLETILVSVQDRCTV